MSEDARDMAAAEIANLTFEDAMRELESIVRDLETGKAKLDDDTRRVLFWLTRWRSDGG